MVANTLLTDKRILVVEDEFFLMEDLCRDLQDAGAVLVGPAPSVQQALALIETEPAINAAILDVNLGGEMAFPVAEALLRREYPFVFTTGYSDSIFSGRYPDVPRVEKPAEFRHLAKALAATMAGPQSSA